MRVGSARALLISATCLLWLAGCSGSGKLPDLFKSSGSDANASAHNDLTGSITQNGDSSNPSNVDSSMLGANPQDDLSLGKEEFRKNNFGLAEVHFRHAVELRPNDGEAWLGLAASYDRLKRFDLADRAYGQVVRIVGPTAEVLNNQGYSYMLRGDYPRARVTLLSAQAKAPNNPFIRNNLALLETSERRRKGIQ
ncbi:MAG TPA: tetratricopeptide repeat protein [Pseudolabrys sp.]|nr:tetratricopeptide repeat protein [Pseudolabrys sp.]